MAHPGSSDSNHLNLAALWVDVMPSTKSLGAEMKRAGELGAKSFSEGFDSDKTANMFGQNFGNALTKGFKSTDFGGAIGSFTSKLTEQVDKDLSAKLRGVLPGMYREVTQADLGDSNAAATPSPVWLNRKPPWSSIAVRSTSSCAASAARIASASASHRRVEPSTSVNRNVTTPDGATTG